MACAEYNVPTPVLSDFITSRRQALLDDSGGYLIMNITETAKPAELASTEAEESYETYELHFPWPGDKGTVDEDGYPLRQFWFEDG